MELPIFPGMAEDSQVLKLAENDLAFQLSDYHVMRNGTNIVFHLKNGVGLSSEQFYNIIGFSELSKFTDIGINEIECDRQGVVKRAKMTFYMRNKLFS